MRINNSFRLRRHILQLWVCHFLSTNWLNVKGKCVGASWVSNGSVETQTLIHGNRFHCFWISRFICSRNCHHPSRLPIAFTRIIQVSASMPLQFMQSKYFRELNEMLAISRISQNTECQNWHRNFSLCVPVINIEKYSHPSACKWNCTSQLQFCSRPLPSPPKNLFCRTAPRSRFTDGWRPRGKYTLHMHIIKGEYEILNENIQIKLTATLNNSHQIMFNETEYIARERENGRTREGKWNRQNEMPSKECTLRHLSRCPFAIQSPNFSLSASYFAVLCWETNLL